MAENSGEKTFWEIIDLFDWEDEESTLEPAIEYLSKQDDESIFSFDEQLAQYLYDLDGIRLGELFMKANDNYLSPDMFLYCRCMMVAQGEKYYNAIKNGSSPTEDFWEMDFEDLLYLASEAWERKHPGLEYPYIGSGVGETGMNEDKW